jgi:hypothetical protein
MVDTQRWKERLYENSALRDDLGDEPAAVALEWGVKQIDTLQARITDEQAFEDAYATLERILRGVNRIVSHVGDYTSDQLRDRVTKVVEWAHTIALPVDLDAIDEWLAEAGNIDEVGRVHDLTQALAPTVSAQALENAAEEMADPEAEVSEDVPILPEESAVPEARNIPAEVVSEGDDGASQEPQETDIADDADEM